MTQIFSATQLAIAPLTLSFKYKVSDSLSRYGLRPDILTNSKSTSSSEDNMKGVFDQIELSKENLVIRGVRRPLVSKVGKGAVNRTFVVKLGALEWLPEESSGLAMQVKDR